MPSIRKPHAKQSAWGFAALLLAAIIGFAHFAYQNVFVLISNSLASLSPEAAIVRQTPATLITAALVLGGLIQLVRAGGGMAAVAALMTATLREVIFVAMMATGWATRPGERAYVVLAANLPELIALQSILSMGIVVGMGFVAWRVHDTLMVSRTRALALVAPTTGVLATIAAAQAVAALGHVSLAGWVWAFAAASLGAKLVLLAPPIMLARPCGTPDG